jgi:type IV pilus assembly protein PilV
MKRIRHSAGRRSSGSQCGFSIIEVLVAAVVLSIGMLGLAGLQMRTLRNNQGALERGVAVLETHAIADALRGDRTNASNNLFDIALNAATPAPGTFANTVIADWRQNLLTELGDTAKGSIDCNGTSCDIVIEWTDSRGAGDTMSLRTTVQI